MVLKQNPTDDNENKVKEYINIYQNGDVKECLIPLLQAGYRPWRSL
jgi:hypothetical protein